MEMFAMICPPKFAMAHSAPGGRPRSRWGGGAPKIQMSPSERPRSCEKAQFQSGFCVIFSGDTISGAARSLFRNGNSFGGRKSLRVTYDHHWHRSVGSRVEAAAFPATALCASPMRALLQL